MKIAVIGCNGFVGSALCRSLSKTNVELIKVSRDNFNQHKDTQFDYIINSAMPSKRFWAQQRPMEDFQATAGLTAELIYNWKYDKFIQISSVSARCQLDHPYGINKCCAEAIVANETKQNLIVRLGGLFGNGLTKGAIHDIVEGNPIFVSGDSKYNFIDVDVAADLILARLDKIGLIEVGSKDQISLQSIASYLGLEVNFGGRLESQYTKNPEPDFPEANEVLTYVSKVYENA